MPLILLLYLLGSLAKPYTYLSQLLSDGLPDVETKIKVKVV